MKLDINISKGIQLILIYILSLIIFLFFTGFVFSNETMMNSGLILLYIYMIVYALKDLNTHITLLVFLITFFTFLMGRMVLPFIFSSNKYSYIFETDVFENVTLQHINLSLFLSLLFVFFGYISVNNKPNSINPIDFESTEIKNVRKSSKVIIYISFIISIILVLEKIKYVSSQGYFSYYVDFKSRLPYAIKILGDCFRPAVYLYLATMPIKRKCKPILLLYIIIGISYLGFGQRGGFILHILFVLTYLFLRNRINNGGKKWIGKKGILSIIIIAPLLMSFMYLYAFYRLEKDIGENKNIIISFFNQQGVSVKVIGYTYEYNDKFPDRKLYTLGDIIDYFNHNIIAQILFGKEPINPQSVNRALNDNSLDSTLSYIVNPQQYLAGGGLGGCYIAEAWKDFGYLGIIIFNFIYGFILASIINWSKKNIWLGAVAFVMFIEIIYAPRARAIKFIYKFFSFGLVFTWVTVWFIVTIYSLKSITKKYEKSSINL